MNKLFLTLLISLLAFIDVNVVPMDRERVMLKGKYYTQAEMNQWLDQIAPRFQHALDDLK
jgi:hypothetical protein